MDVRGGLWIVRLTLNKIKVVSENHGLPDKVVRAHFQDNSGDLVGY